MKKNIGSGIIGTVGSIIFFVGTVAGFYWLWNSAQPTGEADSAIDQKYQKVEIAGLKTEAESLVADKQNAGALPVQAPTADRIGRDNPFAGI